MKRFLAKHSPLLMLGLLCIVLAIISEDFRRTDNLQQVALRTAVIAIIATGELLVILTGGIDLSVGSVAALSGVVGGLSMKAGVPVLLAIVIGTLVGGLCGLINGALVTLLRVPPFIVTLGMMMVARGLALIIANSQPVFGLPPAFDYLGGSRGWWIPVTIMVTVVVFATVMLAYTRFGRSLYAVGGNLQAARLSGLNVVGIRTAAFTLCGLCAGFGGMMLASYTGVASPLDAEMYELDAIAACVIGGASLMGGEGSAPGVLAGALIMKVLVNFCNLHDIDPHWQRVLVGALIVMLVGYDNFRKRRAY